MFTKDLHDHIASGVEGGLPAACVEAYEHGNYGGHAVSYCDTDVINTAFGFTDFNDTFSARRHADEGWLENDISSLQIPGRMTVGLSVGSTNQTFQTRSGATYTPDVPDLDVFGLSDVGADFSVDLSFGETLGVHLYLPANDECFGMRTDPLAGPAEIYPVACNPDDSRQIFDIVDAGAYVRIEHPASDTCLTYPQSTNLDDALSIVTWDCDNGDKPHWILEAAQGTNDARDFTLEFLGLNRPNLCMGRIDREAMIGPGGGLLADPHPIMETVGCNSNAGEQQLMLRSF